MYLFVSLHIAFLSTSVVTFCASEFLNVDLSVVPIQLGQFLKGFVALPTRKITVGSLTANAYLVVAEHGPG